MSGRQAAAAAPGWLASASFKRFTAHKNPLNYSNCIAKHFCDDVGDARPRLAEILGVAAAVVAATKCLFDFHLPLYLSLSLPLVRSLFRILFFFAIFPR